MKLLFLNSNAMHHVFFAMQMAGFLDELTIIAENFSLSAPFEIAHTFETERIDYEKEVFGIDCAMNSRKTIFVESVNSRECIDMINSLDPDLVLVMGTRRLSADFINSVHKPLLNFHGGDSELYRGLDSHLWTIYHEDFANLKVTLHKIELELDTGHIIDQRTIKLLPGMKLYQLRHFNILLCIEMTKELIGVYAETGVIKGRPQVSVGRYYSFMPAVLKEVCLRKFNKHINRI